MWLSWLVFVFSHHENNFLKIHYWTIFCKLLELDPELRCELDIIVERLSRAGATLGSFGFCLFSLPQAAP